MFRCTYIVMLLLALAACATPGEPRRHIEEDAFARYYATDEGRILRVERDGTVIDVSCLPPAMVRGQQRETVMRSECTEGHVQQLGQARQLGTDWDLAGYRIEPETGTCKSLFSPLKKEWLEMKRYSCWNRIWEVPAAVVVYPVMLVGMLVVAAAPVIAPVLLL